ncbi:protein of unknown function [Agreia sp. COWG]|nr:protein of unknown function [Agreia sp. COWG]
MSWCILSIEFSPSIFLVHRGCARAAAEAGLGNHGKEVCMVWQTGLGARRTPPESLARFAVSPVRIHLSC